MANMALIGLPAYELLNIAIGPTEVPTLPASNLDDPEPWRVCRFATSDASLLTIFASLAYPLSTIYRPTALTYSVGGVALVNHSLSIGGEWRVRLFGEGSSLTTERVLPTAVSLAGFTGAFTDIDDDPHNVDANYIQNDGSDTDGAVIATLATPTLAPAGIQLLRVQIEYDDDVDLDESGCVITAFQFTGGGGTDPVQLADWVLEPGSVFPPSGTVFELPFSSAALTNDPNGSDVRLRVDFQDALPDGGAGDAGKVRIGAVDWYCQQLVVGLVADSGWLTAVHDDPDASWGSTPPGTLGVAPQQTAVWVVDGGPVEANEIRVEMRDPYNQSGYVDVGRLLVGPAFVPGINRDWGKLVSLQGRDTVVEGDGGSFFGVRREPLRTLHVPLSWLTPAEAHALIERLWRAGLLTPFVVALMPNDATEGRHTTIYGRCASLPDLSAASANSLRSMMFDVVEKL